MVALLVYPNIGVGKPGDHKSIRDRSSNNERCQGPLTVAGVWQRGNNCIQIRQGEKKKNVENVERFTHKPVQHVEIWPPCYVKENKAKMLQNIAQGRPYAWRFLMDFDTALRNTSPAPDRE